MAAPRRWTVQRWWRAPVLARAPRRRAELALALSAAVALALGTGAGVAVDAMTGSDAGPTVTGTVAELGPVTMTVPADLGPWVAVSDDAARDLRASWTGPVELDGVWGRLAPGSVMVTVLTAAAGAHGGVEQFERSVPQDGPAEWSGSQAHASGSRVVDGVRELVLVTQTDEGDLVILSVSGPQSAFASGELAEAFRTARVE